MLTIRVPRETFRCTLDATNPSILRGMKSTSCPCQQAIDIPPLATYNLGRPNDMYLEITFVKLLELHLAVDGCRTVFLACGVCLQRGSINKTEHLDNRPGVQRISLDPIFNAMPSSGPSCGTVHSSLNRSL
jgi:hypothetical protein